MRKFSLMDVARIAGARVQLAGARGAAGAALLSSDASTSATNAISCVPSWNRRARPETTCSMRPARASAPCGPFGDYPDSPNSAYMTRALGA